MCAVCDATSGDVIWRNDNISHQEAGREDLSPQGYLLASPEHIHVPSGRTRPKSFDRQSGKLLGTTAANIEISTAQLAGTSAIMLDGRLHHYSPGSHIAGTAAESYVTNGTHLARIDINSLGKIREASRQLKDELRELYRKQKSMDDAEFERQSNALRSRIQTLDNQSVRWRVSCEDNSSLIVAGNLVFVGGENHVAGYDRDSGKLLWESEIEGDARGLAAAAGQLFVSTSGGTIIAFGPAQERVNDRDEARNGFPTDRWSEFYRDAAADILERSGVKRGFCLVVDSDEGRLAYELARQSELKIYCVENDAQKVARARDALSRAGLYGHRVVVHQADATAIPYSNFFANLIVSDRAQRLGQLPAAPHDLVRHLKPAGGVICLGWEAVPPPVDGAQGVSSQKLKSWVSQAGLGDQSTVQQGERWVTLTRSTLPGAGNWSHQYANPGATASSGDQVVQGGLGVLWYGDPGPELMVNRHQGAVGPLVVDGRMFIQGENSLMAYDTYNGLFLWKVDNPEAVRTGVFQNRAPGNLAAGEDHLFHMVRDKVYVHDVATGEVQATFLIPPSLDRETHEWGYIAYRDGRLIGTATAREVIKRKFRRRGNPGGAATDAIFAIDVKTGNHLWVYQGKSIDFQTIALGPNRVFFIDSSVTSGQRQEMLQQEKEELKALTGEAAKLAEQRMKKLDVRMARCAEFGGWRIAVAKPCRCDRL